MSEFKLFPITQKNGFEVDCQANYDLLMYHIAKTTGLLQLEYPDDVILVTYPVGEEGV